MQQAADNSSKRTTVLLAVGVGLLACIPFLPAVTAGFSQFDDPGIFSDVKGYQGLGGANLRWMFSTTQMGHYQPLTWLSYAIEYSLWGRDAAGPWGVNPVGLHLTNIALHGLNAALVFLVALRLIAAAIELALPARALGAAAAALVFALHPLRVESVAWLTERRDVLSTAFLLLALLAYLRAYPPGSTAPHSKKAALGSVLLLGLSLLAKAWGMTFFVVLMVLDWFPLRRLPIDPRQWTSGPARRVLSQKAPFAVLGLAAAVMASVAQSSMRLNVRPLSEWGIGARAAQAMFGLMFYVQKTVWPTRLSPIYEMPRVFEALEPRFVAAYLFAAAMLVMAIACRRRFPALTAVAAVYAIVLSPVLGVFQSGPQLVADRYAYIASIPWAVLIGAGAAWLWQGPRRRWLALAAPALVALSAQTWRQTGYWRNSEALFKHAIDVGADGPVAREFYGRQLIERGDKVGALAQFDRGVELDPGYAECWFSRANTLRDLGRYPEAEASFMSARRLMRDSWRAALKQGLMYLDLANQYKDKPEVVAKALKGATDCFRDAVANTEKIGYNPMPGQPYLMLAAALDMQGDDQGSRAMLLKASACPDTRAEAERLLREPATPGPR